MHRPTSTSARRPAILLLCALAAGCGGGGSPPSPPAPEQAPPVLTRGGLVRDGLLQPSGWQGLPATLRLEGHDLAVAWRQAAPWRLTLTRVVDEGGRSVDEVVANLAVTVAGPPEAETVTVDLGAALPVGGYRAGLSIGGGELVGGFVFMLFPPPGALSLDRPLVCLAGADAELRIHGANTPFAFAGDFLLEDEQGALELEVQGHDDCHPSVPIFYSGSYCETAVVRLPANRGAGQARLTYRPPPTLGPPPASPSPIGLTFETAGRAEVPPAIAVAAAPLELVVYQGGPFRVQDGVGPEVRMGGAVVPSTAEACTPTADPAVQHCRTLRHTVPQGFAPGTTTIEVTTAAGCSATAPVKVVEPPVLLGFTQGYTCDGGGGALPLGSGLAEVDWSYSVGGTGPWSPMSGFSAAPLPYAPALVRATSRSTPPVVTEPAWLTRWPGPILMNEPIYPAFVYSGATRPVHLLGLRASGQVSGRLVPEDGGAPIPVAASSSGSEQTIEFPAAGGDRRYAVELSDESPCGPSLSFFRFSTRSDPVELAWGFESTSQAPSRRVSMATADLVHAELTPGAGVTGGAATGWADADPGNWYLAWFPFGIEGDHGALRFWLKATGEGAPTGAPGVIIRMADAYGHRRDLQTDLPPPAPGVWTAYEVRLDDMARWTAVEPTGLVHPATAWDLTGRIDDINILGGWWAGPGTVAVDDLTLELSRGAPPGP